MFDSLWLHGAHQAPLSMGFPRKNIGVGCHALLLGIFPTQDQTQFSRNAGRFFNVCTIREVLESLLVLPSSGLSRAVFKFPKIPTLLMAMRSLPQNTRGSPRSGYLALPSGSDGRELEEEPATTPGCLNERDAGQVWTMCSGYILTTWLLIFSVVKLGCSDLSILFWVMKITTLRTKYRIYVTN